MKKLFICILLFCSSSLFGSPIEIHQDGKKIGSMESGQFEILIKASKEFHTMRLAEMQGRVIVTVPKDWKKWQIKPNKKTKIPITIAWFDERGKIIKKVKLEGILNLDKDSQPSFWDKIYGWYATVTAYALPVAIIIIIVII